MTDNNIKNKEKKQEYNKGFLKSFAGFMHGGRFMLTLSAIFMFMGIACNYLIPQIIRFTVDNVLKGEKVPVYLTGIVNKMGGVQFFKDNIYILGLLVVAITLILAIFAYVRRRTSMLAAEKTSKRIKDNLYSHILSLPYSWHSTIKTGDIIQRATQDTDLIKRYVNNQLIELFRVVALMIIGIAVMLTMNLKLTLVALFFVILTIIFSSIYFPRIAKTFKKTDEEEGLFTALLQENLTGIRVVRAFGRQADEKAKYEKKNESYVSLWIKFGKKLSIFWGTGDLFAGLQTVTTLILGAYLSVKGELSLGELLAFISYNQILIWPVRNLGRILAETGKVKAGVIRLQEVFAAKPEHQNKNGLCSPLNGDIEFKNVSFSYDFNRTIINNLSFTIKGGSVFGIVGATGSGKSTLMHLINRLYDPLCGEITIGGNNILEFDQSYLRKNVGLVLQESFLFSRNFKDNILLSAGSCSYEQNAEEEKEESELDKYIEIASLESTVNELKEGYKTIVGEKGVTLSGGQKQRVAIARTLINKPPIVIFDDSLSAVDTETDKKIRDAISNNLKGTTVIIISHRLTSLMHADKILVLNNGCIEDIGSHAELISKEGTYKRLYQIQSSLESEELDTSRLESASPQSAGDK